ncbi:hypothetical protein ACTXT7_005227 [Hymenolepis weldensis]
MRWVDPLELNSFPASIMQRQGVTDSVSLQSTLSSSFINEFNAIEQALNSEIDFISPRSSPYLQGSASRSDISNEEENNNQSIASDSADEQYESDSVEVVRPPNTRTLPIEDPIETYDLIIDEMKSNGVQWVPADQMSKSLSEVRLAAPDGHQPKNVVPRTKTYNLLIFPTIMQKFIPNVHRFSRYVNSLYAARIALKHFIKAFEPDPSGVWALTPAKSSSQLVTNGIINVNNRHQQPISGSGRDTTLIGITKEPRQPTNVQSFYIEYKFFFVDSEGPSSNIGFRIPKPRTTNAQKPTSDATDQSASENARKLRELQNQLNQLRSLLITFPSSCRSSPLYHPQNVLEENHVSEVMMISNGDSIENTLQYVEGWHHGTLGDKLEFYHTYILNILKGNWNNEPGSCGLERFSYKTREKATRKQQEDYIQQLQHYYDNLLAKHAAAEMTIDHFRFRNQVDPNDASPTKTPNSNSKAPFLSTSLRGSKLISASLDTCSPSPLVSKSNHRQPHTTGSLMTLREDDSPNEEPVKGRTSLVTPKVHLVPLSSMSQNPLEVESDQQYNTPALCKPAVGINGEDIGHHNANSSLNASRGDLGRVNHRHQCSELNVDMATQEAARNLESQLASSLAAIHDRLNAIQARLSDDNRNETLTAIKSELEDLSRRYQAGLYLWSEAGVFDGKTVVGSRLNHLTQRLERVTSGEQEHATTTTPARPSSLSLVDSHRSNSTESNQTTSSVHTISLGRQGSMSSPVSVLHNAAAGDNTSNGERGSSSTPISSESSLESAESFFVRLLTRYNKLKVVPGHSKDVESLMQRMLQLSDRYSNQSTVIFPPKSLRRMFESDYSINTGVNEPLVADHRVFTQPLSTKLVNDVSTKPHQMISPDSGVAQTPLGSSGSSGTSCYGVAVPSQTTPLIGNFRETSDLSRPKSADDPTVIHGTPAMDTERKQSDSGLWATDSYSAAPTPLYKDANIPSASSTEHSDEIDIDPSASRPSKILSDEVMSLEADIKRLREGIARLTSSASVSSGPLYRGSVAKSDSSSSTCEEQPRRKSSRRQTLGSNRKSNTLSSATKRSSLTRRPPRLPISSSSSSDNYERGAAFSPCATRPRYPHSSRSRNHRSLNPGPPPLEVIGSSINPKPRHPPDQTRVYRRNSSTSRGQVELSSVGHRRSHSTTGRIRSCYHPCGSCGGSGYNINTIGREPDEEFAYEPPLHNRTISCLMPVPVIHLKDDRFTMPTRVIYEYSRQGPVIRLPVHDYGGWTERVYGMKELYGSSVSPQTGRAYNTIGHQPSTNLKRSWLSPNQPTWDSTGRQSSMIPATSSPVIPQRSSRKTRQYVPSVGSNSLFYHHSQLGDTFSSGSDDRGTPQRDVAVLPTSRSFCNNTSRSRRRSSSRHMSIEQEDFPSPTNAGINAFSTAQSVTQMAHRLNNKLSRHQDYREYTPHQQQSFQQLSSSSVRHSSRSRHQGNGTYLTTMLDDDF